VFPISSNILYLILFFVLLSTFLCLLTSLNYFLTVLLFLDLLILEIIIGLSVLGNITNVPILFSTALLLLGVAAAETAIGLGLFIVYYRAFNRVDLY